MAAPENVITPKNDPARLDKVVNLCKRRGFVFPSGEIYGGTRSAWDYGPLGVELKENIKRQWWKAMVTGREDVVGLDSSVILPRQVWVASGHVGVFNDPLVECTNCHKRFRADTLAEEYVERTGKAASESDLSDVPCPNCGNRGQYTEPRDFNMMLKTYLGPVESEEGLHYLRPETAQGIFVNFLNVQTTSRRKPPFGIGQMGKSFRNEITPGNFIFRTREFEQMEMQFFVKPGTDAEWFERWRELRMSWHHALGLAPAKLRWHEHGPTELAHYARAAYDIEYEFPFGWNEIEGIHNRGDFDLGRHQQHSGKKLEYFDQGAGERYLPFIVETSAGADRVTLTVLVDAYREEQVEGETRVVLGFHPAVAPIKAAILPLVKKDGMPELAMAAYDDMRKRFPCFYDDSGAIGRRYRRMDEAGTPFCVTVDGESLVERTVTVRHRDSMQQDRVSLDRLAGFLEDALRG